MYQPIIYKDAVVKVTVPSKLQLRIVPAASLNHCNQLLRTGLREVLPLQNRLILGKVSEPKMLLQIVFYMLRLYLT